MTNERLAQLMAKWPDLSPTDSGELLSEVTRLRNAHSDRVPILRVGTVHQESTRLTFDGWHFGGQSSDIAIGGWTVDEMATIASDLDTLR